jgi:hypothetical protein
MLGQIDYVFAEAEVDYRHERLMAQVHQRQAPRRPLVVVVREAWRGLRRRPVVRQPMPAPHHLTAS